jgi:hypothetical protein
MYFKRTVSRDESFLKLYEFKSVLFVAALSSG